MKKTSLILASVLTISYLQANNIEIKQEGMKYIKMLGGELKQNLQSKMKEDPTGESALGFCIGTADSITEKVNKKLPSHASVRRTAIKYRSDSNKPDAKDIEVMNTYIEKLKNKTFSPKSIIMTQDGNNYRVYKPLVTKAVCLKCHGENISDKLKPIISKAYPNDLAINFKEGDFRGVIVSEIKKD